MAHWSQTLGMTEEHTPTPISATTSRRSRKARAASPNPIGITNRAAATIALPKRLTA